VPQLLWESKETPKPLSSLEEMVAENLALSRPQTKASKQNGSISSPVPEHFG
jgi:hypothetical protein